MSLGLVSPLLNRGVRSRWLASLPGAGSKMLTIDSNGDTAFQDIPSAAWGSITGTLSSQTDLQNALDAKLSLTGGTLTGAGSAGTSTLRVNAGSGSSFTQINDNGTVVIDSDAATGTFPLTLKYAGTTVASVSYQGTITGAVGSFGSLNIDSGFVILDTDAANVLAQRSSTSAQTFRVYNTFTDASNYEHLQLGWSSNVARIGTVAAGTGSVRQIEIVQLNDAGAKQNYVYQFDFNTSGYGGRFNINAANGLRRLTISGRPDQAYIQFESTITSAWFGIGTEGSGDSTRNAIRFYNAASGGGATLITSTGIPTILRFGGLTSSFPAIKRNGTAINFRLADDSADCDITAAAATFSGVVTVSATGSGRRFIAYGVETGFTSAFTEVNSYGAVGITAATSAPSDPSYSLFGGLISGDAYNRITMQLNNGAPAIGLGPGNASRDYFIIREGVGIAGIRNGTNAMRLNIYNTYTDASNYERAKIAWESNVLRIGTEKAGTGSARAVEIQTDGTTRLTVGATGDVTTAGNLSVGNNSIYLGGSGVIRLADYTRIHTPDSYGPIDIAPMTNNVTGVVRVYNTIRSLTNYERLECGQAYNANAFIRTAAGGTGTRRNLEIDAPEIKIAIATTQKIGFYNATPVVQPAAVADATDAASVITQLNLLLSRMRDLGLIAT